MIEFTSIKTMGTGHSGHATDAQASRRVGSHPPSLIGGVNSHVPVSQLRGEVGIDWLAGSFPTEHVEAVLLRMNRHFGSAESLEYGFYGYDRSYVFHPFGSRVLYDSSEPRSFDRHNGRAVVQIPGIALSSMSSHDLRELIFDLVFDFSFKCTRIDICFDDFDRIIAPRELVEVCESDNFSGYRRWQHIAPRKSGGRFEGDTLAFGRRGQNGSGKYLRVYDKNLESDGEVDSIRWEVEFSKDKASKVCARLAFSNDYEDWCAIQGALVGGSIDFVDRGLKLEKNLSRLTRLPFWERVVSALGSYRIRGEVPVRTVDSVENWVKRSVSSSLAMLRSAYGSDAFDDWLEDTLEGVTLSVRHEKIVEEYNRQNCVGVPF